MTYRYLGSFGPDGTTIAVFSDGQTILNARQGEILQDRFIVEEIGPESVEIGYVDFPDVRRQTQFFRQLQHRFAGDPLQAAVSRGT